MSTGPIPRKSRIVNGVGVQVEDTQICVVMVGLPARGKSLIAQKGKSIFCFSSICDGLLLDRTPFLTTRWNSYPLLQVALHRCQSLQRGKLPSP